MRNRRPTVAGEYQARAWPLFALLALGVLVPTVCVLWFMVAAVRNERLAVRQRLTETYRRDVAALQQRLDAYWAGKVDALAAVDPDTPAAAFHSLVTARVCDSVVVYDEAGSVAYPAAPVRVGGVIESSPWAQARRLEHQTNAPGAAAIVYQSIAAHATDPNQAARALVAQGRCLVKAGRIEPALEILTEQLADPRYAATVDRHGRLIVPNAQLLALDLIARFGGLDGPYGRLHQPTFAALQARLNNYGAPAVPSAQRLFLMTRLTGGAVRIPPFATQTAERLAGELLAAGEVRPAGPALQRTRAAGLWRLATGDGRVTALFRRERILGDMRGLIDADDNLPGAKVSVAVPGEAEPAGALVTVPISEHVPGWSLAVRLTGDDPFAAAADRQVTVYVWTGTLVVAGILLLAAVAMRVIARQVRLTRLKNDLIATVSHELKTPLASMRVLVDTLLAGRVTDSDRAEEYLRMIATENHRLSRLIDNFLTFSRMERNKRAFELAETRIDEVLDVAVGAVGERFSGPGCRLEVHQDDDLPAVIADADALVIVLTNLLDNAWKYTGGEKHVTVRAYAENGHVCLAVTDNGVGLSRRSARKVFQRFYQVDRSLTRAVGGIGLGLSIVKFIVDAHGGDVEVGSRLGEGSTFTVKLPVDGPPEMP